MDTKTKMITIIVISIVVVLLLTYVGMRKVVVPWMSEKYVTEQVEKAEAEKNVRIKDLNKRIAILSKQLFESQQKYANLRAIIAQKVQEAGAIKVPETKDEIIKRFTDLSYPPQSE